MSDSESAPVQPVTLLYVEDEPLISMAITEALESAGYTVMTAATGAEALECFDEHAADLAGLITDIRLGDGPSGWDLAHHARSVKPDLPVIYTTGDSAHNWPANGVPMSVLIQKPFAPAQAITAISSLLNRDV